MRISDWSSDVCSSDLLPDQAGDVLRELAQFGIGLRSGLLQYAQGRNNGSLPLESGHAYGEIMYRTLGLRAPITGCRNLDFAHGIGFDARRCHSCSCSVNSLGLYPNRLLTDFNYTPVASRQVGITRLPSWRYLCLESIRPGFGHVEHAVGEAPFVVEPHEQIGKAVAVGAGLAAVDDGRMRIVIEVDRCMRMVGIGQKADIAIGRLHQQGVQLRHGDIVFQLHHQVYGRYVQYGYAYGFGLDLDRKSTRLNSSH